MSEEITEESVASNYKAPAVKSVEEILHTDLEDESLRKYKETLLGKDVVNVVLEPNNPKNVLVRALVLVVEGRSDVRMDLDALQNVENSTFVVKEGVNYRLRIEFHVQREIVAGLKYLQKFSKLGVPVHKDELMVGSYAPKTELHHYLTPIEEAPSGMLHRGTYKVKSLFSDDDKNVWLQWEWNLEIKKDW